MNRECPKCPLLQELTEGQYFDYCQFCGYEEDKREQISLLTPEILNQKYLEIDLTSGIYGYQMSPSIFKKDQSHRGFKFFFHAGEVLHKYEPSHIHVEGHGYWMEIWLPSCSTKDKGNMPKEEITGIKKFVKQKLSIIMAKWEEYKKRATSR